MPLLATARCIPNPKSYRGTSLIRNNLPLGPYSMS